MSRRVYKGQVTSSTGDTVLRKGMLSVDLTTNQLFVHNGVVHGGVPLSGGGSSGGSSLASPNGMVTFSLDDTDGATLSGGQLTLGSSSSTITAGLGLEINSTVGIGIAVNNEDPNLENPQWFFNSNGSMTFPNNTLLSSSNTFVIAANDDLTVRSGDDLLLEAIGDDVRIRSADDTSISTGYDSSNGSSQHTWRFDNTGSLVFPDNSIQTTAFTGFVISSNPTLVVDANPEMAMDNLFIRVVDGTPSGINIQLMYTNPANPVVLSGSVNSVNLWNGSTTVAQNNNVWVNLNAAALTVSGDTIVALITDHVDQRIYRITAVVRDVPLPGTLGSAYCVIERLQ